MICGLDARQSSDVETGSAQSELEQYRWTRGFEGEGHMRTSRPADAEYTAYYARYVALVPELDILTVLRRQSSEVATSLGAVSPDREKFRYAPEKWSIREVCGHLIDGERVFGHQAFRFSRWESAPLPSFEENAYVLHSRYLERPLADLLAEFLAVRTANLHFLGWLSEDDWARKGTVGDELVSVRALAFIMAGHVRHHMTVLRDQCGVAPGP